MDCMPYHVVNKRLDPDQLAPQKPADQDLHCFPLCFIINTHCLDGILQVNWIKIIQSYGKGDK